MVTIMTVILMTNPMSIMTKKTAISPSQNGSLNIRSSRETWFSHFYKSNKQTHRQEYICFIVEKYELGFISESAN